MDISGNQLTKRKDSQTVGSIIFPVISQSKVVNLVPPRELWPQSQGIRNQHLPNQRCGPHFSFVEPFITEEQFPRVVELLTPVLAEVKPFTVHLNKMGHFAMKGSAMLFVEPTIDPPHGLQSLLNAITGVLPQCNDLSKKSKDKVYKPHLSIRRFHSEAELLEAKPEYSSNWKPQVWVVKEIYLLSRKGGDPFEIKHIIPLGGDKTAPHFGLVSITDSESQMARSLVFCGVPQDFGGIDNLETLFKEGGFTPKQIEYSKNPDGKNRDCGVIEFTTREETDTALEKFSHTCIYIKRLCDMAYPDVMGGSCSW